MVSFYRTLDCTKIDVATIFSSPLPGPLTEADLSQLAQETHDPNYKRPHIDYGPPQYSLQPDRNFKQSFGFVWPAC